MLIGAHVRFADPLAAAAATGSECVQVFLSDPQSWKKPPPRDDAQALRECAMPIYVHAPYLVNVVAGNNKIRIPSRKILQDTCDAAAAIGATAVIVHGGHVGSDDEMAEGFVRWGKALDILETDVPVYIENTAGGTHAMSRHFETIARLWEVVGPRGTGFCLDTCHAHASGEVLVDAVARIRAITGRIDLVHCNDSRDEHGSGRDRHENLGKGMIGLDVLVAMVSAAGAPVVCETPEDGLADDVATLRAEVGVRGVG